MKTLKSYDPESLAIEFDLLMERAGISPAPAFRSQMLLEFSQLRAEMDMVHELANATAPRGDMLLPITKGRVEQ